MLIVDSKAVLKTIEKCDIKIVNVIDNLAIFKIFIDEQDIMLPGLIYLFSKQLAKNGVAVIELGSSFNEISFVIEEKMVEKAINAFIGLIERFKG